MRDPLYRTNDTINPMQSRALRQCTTNLFIPTYTATPTIISCNSFDHNNQLHMYYNHSCTAVPMCNSYPIYPNIEPCCRHTPAIREHTQVFHATAAYILRRKNVGVAWPTHNAANNHWSSCGSPNHDTSLQNWPAVPSITTSCDVLTLSQHCRQTGSTCRALPFLSMPADAAQHLMRHNTRQCMPAKTQQLAHNI